MKATEVKRRLGVKVIAVTASMILTMSTLAGCGAASLTANNSEEVMTEEQQEDLLSNMIDNHIINHSSGDKMGKEESVYVLADASGKTTEIIVSEWLKNVGGDAKLADASDLKDIVNLKGDESFEKQDGNQMTWNADGSDIYYQGKSDKELPVNVRLTYFLEGEEIAPQDLAGKSGNVTIRFDYENNATTTIDVNGKEEEAKIPFAVLSAMMLPTDVFSNIEVKNAKVLEEGNTNIVIGMGFPGLKESLKLDDLDIENADDMEIPDYVEVSAYADHFALDMTMSVVLNDVMNDISLTNDINLDNISDSMNELTDASVQLVDGTGELKNGVGTLSDGAHELYDGTGKLKDGIFEYTDGVKTLGAGIGEYTTGVATLGNGIKEYTDGVSTLGNGIKEYTTGVDTLGSGVKEYATGVSTLTNGLKEYTAGVATLNNGIKEYTTGVSALSTGIDSLKTGTASLSSGAEQLKTGATSAKAGADQLVAGYKGDGTAQNPGAIAGATALASGSSELNTAVKQGLSTTLQELSTRTGLSVAELTPEMCATLCSKQGAAQHVNPAFVTGVANDMASLMMGAMSSDNSDNSQEPVESRPQKPVVEDDNSDAKEDSTDEEDKGDSSTEGKDASEKPETEDDAEKNDDQKQDDEKTDDQNGQNSETTDTDQSEEQKGSDESDSTIIDDISNDIAAQVFQMYAAADGAGMDPAVLMAAASYNTVSQIMILANSAASTYQVCGATQQLSAGATSLSAGVTQLYNGTLQLQTGLGTLNDGITNLYGGAKQLDAGAGDLKAGSTKLTTASGELTAGANKLATASGEILSGTSKLTGASGQLTGGADKLMAASGELRSGADKLNSASGELRQGADKLNNASGELNNGVTTLNNASEALRDGSASLYDGNSQLIDGISKLQSGATELNDGMIKFDEEGISKISELFGNEAKDVIDRIKAVTKAGSNYKTFTDLPEGMDGSVKFVIRTDAIK